MAAATVSAATAVSIIVGMNQSAGIADVRVTAVNHAAQIQLVHSLASIGSATFMNVGGTLARFAPAFFLCGILAYSLPIYLDTPSGYVRTGTKLCAIALLAAGWLTLLASTSTIDQPSAL